MRTAKAMILALGALVAWAAVADAQQPPPQQPQRPPAQRGAQAPPPEQVPAPEIQLIYERETFQYPGDRRRDPFEPLLSSEEQGPRFEELSLLGVIYSNIAERSMAMLVDQGGKRYRVRRGDIVGNARVLDIGPLRVVFAVDNFGIVRQEMLELKAKEREGA